MSNIRSNHSRAISVAYYLLYINQIQLNEKHFYLHIIYFNAKYLKLLVATSMRVGRTVPL